MVVSLEINWNPIDEMIDWFSTFYFSMRFWFWYDVGVEILMEHR